MTAGGFVLAGGRSSRMGRDKALLPYLGRTMLEHVAAQVLEAAGTVAIVADPARYAHFGFPVIPDERGGCGPLGGIVAALAASTKEWNLMVACDMPQLDAPFLRNLIAAACEMPGALDCLVPLGPCGPEPLCAVYHRRSLPRLRSALDRNILKMKAVMASLDAHMVSVRDPGRFRNVNTPEDRAEND